MKSSLKLLICLLLLLICYILQAQTEDVIFRNGKFEENSVVYLYADNVNIREKPSTNSKVIANLSIATKVKVISKSDETYTINGYNTYWYLVSFEKDGNKQTGFVWGGFLSAVSYTTTNDSGEIVYFLFAISGYSKEASFSSTLKAVINGKIVSSIAIQPEETDQYDGNYGYDISGKIMGNKGLDNIKKIIVITFSYPACGYTNGDVVVLWNGKDLIYGCESLKVSEAGIFSFSTELIFPSDQGGKANRIIRKEETIQYDEEGNEQSKTMKKITFIWNGYKLIEQKNEQ